MLVYFSTCYGSSYINLEVLWGIKSIDLVSGSFVPYHTLGSLQPVLLHQRATYCFTEGLNYVVNYGATDADQPSLFDFFTCSSKFQKKEKQRYFCQTNDTMQI